MDKEFKNIQRQNRKVWVVLGILVLLSLLSIVLSIRYPRVSTIQQNYVGQNGRDGNDGQSIQGYEGQAGRTPVKGIDYVDGKDATVDYGMIFAHVDSQIASIPRPTNGSDGVNARNSEFDCQNGNFVTRYEGDDGWRILQENSIACRGTRR